MTQVKFRERAASRKFVLMVAILLFGSLCLALPAISLAFGVKLAALMTGGEYVSLVLGSFGIYSGANVAQKKLVEAPRPTPPAPPADDMIGD